MNFKPCRNTIREKILKLEELCTEQEKIFLFLKDTDVDNRDFTGLYFECLAYRQKLEDFRRDYENLDF